MSPGSLPSPASAIDGRRGTVSSAHHHHHHHQLHNANGMPVSSYSAVVNLVDAGRLKRSRTQSAAARDIIISRRANASSAGAGLANGHHAHMADQQFAHNEPAVGGIGTYSSRSNRTNNSSLSLPAISRLNGTSMSQAQATIATNSSVVGASGISGGGSTAAGLTSNYSSAAPSTNVSPTANNRVTSVLGSNTAILNGAVSVGNAGMDAPVKTMSRANQITPAEAERRVNARIAAASAALAVSATTVERSRRERKESKEDTNNNNNNDNTAERDAETIRTWQRQWKKVLATSRFYFDGIDIPGIDKYKRVLVSYGAKIVMFFSSDVTHVITNKPLHLEYSAQDIIGHARQKSMKLWSYEKFVRFLSHLAEDPTTLTKRTATNGGHINQSETSNNLSRLLREEKANGPLDSDPRAIRDDMHYFKGPYVYVRDITSVYRPVMVREYAKVVHAADGEWPQFRASGHGKCPFVIDNNYRNVPKQEKQVVQEHSRKRTHAVASQKVEQVAIEEDENDENDEPAKHDSEQSADIEVLHEVAYNQTMIDAEERAAKRFALQPIKSTSARANSGRASVIQTRKSVAEAKDHMAGKPATTQQVPAAVVRMNFSHELVATGINMSNLTSNIKSMTQSAAGNNGGTGDGVTNGNGLGANKSMRQSKEMDNLKRKIFDRKKKPLPVPPVVVRKDKVAVKDMRPGYCENCKDRFDDFDEHTRSRKHRKFALNHENFADLDNLLKNLERRPRTEMV
ncbi:Dfp1/Him1, central region-domain-containing protein [Lipomyces japonicus]|uniref:Dfp1/Him1, central region-domain-containing protein n=1 Tax=Lipomyces japonicus TaxID=56871 RepID=UPI0034CD14D1